ncbi:MAG TPA: DUF373 family protein [archaeon]|nr:DUF373 family protein [archaeon]
MAEPRSEAVEKPSKILILCVDRDDDIGVKGGVKTPIIGNENVSNAATKLALNDPEEADANAMFEAVRTYRNLKDEEKEHEHQVAVISGSQVGGVQADRKLIRELNDVLKTFPAEYAILVSDGYSDEIVIPIIQSRVPIMSVKRVIVRHSEAVEESWAVFGRYVRLLVENPKYSRIILGVPGILLVFFAVFYFLGVWQYAWEVALIILGIVLFVKGFGIDKMLSNVTDRMKKIPVLPSPIEQVRIYAAAVGIILVIVACYSGGTYVASTYGSVKNMPIESSFVILFGYFLQQSIYLIVTGVAIFLIGSVIHHYFTHDVRIWQNIVGVVITITIYPVVLEISKILITPTYPLQNLTYWVSIGIAASVVSILAVYSAHRRFSDYFRKAEEVGKS